MAVVVKDMELPTCCARCDFVALLWKTSPENLCCRRLMRTITTWTRRLPDCPLVACECGPLPPEVESSEVRAVLMWNTSVESEE